MRTHELCTEEEVVSLVHSFYARIRQDEVLGPIFDARIADWDHHLTKLVDFWSAMLRGTRRFRGAPLQKHQALPGLDAALFQQWLLLLRKTTAALGNPPMQREADAMARQIADNFWQRYQSARDPLGTPQSLDAVSILPVLRT